MRTVGAFDLRRKIAVIRVRRDERCAALTSLARHQHVVSSDRFRERFEFAPNDPRLARIFFVERCPLQRPAKNASIGSTGA
jgi:hypothetical protein